MKQEDPYIRGGFFSIYIQIRLFDISFLKGATFLFSFKLKPKLDGN